MISSLENYRLVNDIKLYPGGGICFQILDL